MSEIPIKHAVYEDFRLVMLDTANRRLYQQLTGFVPMHVSQLWELAQELGITHIWIMRDSAVDLMGYNFFSEREGYSIFLPLSSGTKREEFPRAARCWKEQAPGTHAIFINFPFRTPWDWEVSSHLDILATLDYLNAVIPGCRNWWSPASTGEWYLRKLFSATRRLESYLADCEVDLSTMPFKRADRDIFFRGVWTPDLIGQYLHVVDINSHHPAAASYMKTGVGTPEHVRGVDISQPIKRPGIYRITGDIGLSIFDGIRLPKIVETEWVTLATLRYAIKKGYHVQIQEAYLFGAQHVLFDDWARDLWLGRQLLKDEGRFKHPVARTNAQYSVKSIMNFTISSLRVNWWADMLGQARVAELAKIETLAGDGHYPLYCYHDEMGYASHQALIDDALPGILGRQNGLGGCKHVCTVRITEQMFHDCKGARPATIHKWVEARAREIEEEEEERIKADA